MVLLLLGAIWAAFLLPPLLRARAEHRPHGSIVDFRNQLHVLGRTTPGGSMGLRPSVPASRPAGGLTPPSAYGAVARPRRTSSAAKRRRDLFFGLLGLAVATLLLSFAPGFAFLRVVHLAVDLVFATYVGALVYMRNLAAEREMKVRFMPQGQAEPAFALRQTAN